VNRISPRLEFSFLSGEHHEEDYEEDAIASDDAARVCWPCLGDGWVIAVAPAFLRGQNLNNKLNIAFIACGGRANASLNELTVVPGASAPPADEAAALADKAAAVPLPKGRRRRIPTRTSSFSAT